MDKERTTNLLGGLGCRSIRTRLVDKNTLCRVVQHPLPECNLVHEAQQQLCFNLAWDIINEHSLAVSNEVKEMARRRWIAAGFPA